MKIKKVLKPCPFCGDEAIILAFIEGYRVGCIQLFACRGAANTSRAYDTEAEAVEAWNKRAECDAEMRGEEDG